MQTPCATLIVAIAVKVIHEYEPIIVLVMQLYLKVNGYRPLCLQQVVYPALNRFIYSFTAQAVAIIANALIMAQQWASLASAVWQQHACVWLRSSRL